MVGVEQYELMTTEAATRIDLVGEQHYNSLVAAKMNDGDSNRIPAMRAISYG